MKNLLGLLLAGTVACASLSTQQQPDPLDSAEALEDYIEQRYDTWNHGVDVVVLPSAWELPYVAMFNPTFKSIITCAPIIEFLAKDSSLEEVLDRAIPHEIGHSIVHTRYDSLGLERDNSENTARFRYMDFLFRLSVGDERVHPDAIQNFIGTDSTRIEPGIIRYIVDEGLADHYARDDEPERFIWPDWVRIDTYEEFDHLANEYAYAIIEHWLEGQEEEKAIDYILTNAPRRFGEMRDFKKNMQLDLQLRHVEDSLNTALNWSELPGVRLEVTQEEPPRRSVLGTYTPGEERVMRLYLSKIRPYREYSGEFHEVVPLERVAIHEEAHALHDLMAQEELGLERFPDYRPMTDFVNELREKMDTHRRNSPRLRNFIESHTEEFMEYTMLALVSEGMARYTERDGKCNRFTRPVKDRFTMFSTPHMITQYLYDGGCHMVKPFLDLDLEEGMKFLMSNIPPTEFFFDIEGYYSQSQNLLNPR